MVRLKVALVDDDGRTLPDWVSESLAKEDIHLVVHNCTTREELTQYAGDADIVWLFGSRILTAENLALLLRCGAIIRTGTGTDNVAVDAATELGIVVANTPEAHCDEVADHTIALLFAVVRQIAVQDRLVRQGIWDPSQGMPCWHLKGNTLGLIGFGRTAHLVIRKLSQYEMTVLAYDPHLCAQQIESAGVQARGLDEVVTQSDFVSLHCPLTKET
ncbi:MAG: NAD(P)-dependent oxidoreductase, partial [Anaerolineae bacterium]